MSNQWGAIQIIRETLGGEGLKKCGKFHALFEWPLMTFQTDEDSSFWSAFINVKSHQMKSDCGINNWVVSEWMIGKLEQ